MHNACLNILLDLMDLNYSFKLLYKGLDTHSKFLDVSCHGLVQAYDYSTRALNTLPLAGLSSAKTPPVLQTKSDFLL